MARGSSPSTLGWAVLAAGLVGAVALLAVLLPGDEDGICPLDGTYVLPSGREARLCEILTETQPFTETDWLVVRMVVPGLPVPGGDGAHGDPDWVCETIARPVFEDTPPARVVVQLMAEPFPRGEPAPGIIQSIEAYSIREGACIWELL
jgi:hypothetical protein